MEHAAAKRIAAHLTPYCGVTIDKLGNIIGTKEGAGHHVLLDAHLDQIGMIVTGHEPNGFLRVAKCGSMDLRVLCAAEVSIHCADQTYYGVVPASAPHLNDDAADIVPDWADVLVDTGLTQEEAERDIPLGTRVTLRQSAMELGEDRVTGAALDNRAGVACVLRCLELLEGEPTCKITVCFSAQEETGGDGAMVAGFEAQPDSAVTVDVSFAQSPGISPHEAQGKLGGGTMIGVSPRLSSEISDMLTKLARRDDIPYQMEIMGGRTGTNADLFQHAGRGIPCGLLSIPLRNMHTAVELADLDDIEATAQLLAAYVRERSHA
jgi:endoglucanase